MNKITSKKDLEDRVLEYNPAIREAIERDPRAASKLEEIAGKNYDKYRPYISGAAQTTGKVGRGLGYLGDAVFIGSAILALVNPAFAPYMLTGLLAKKFQVGAQIPEAVKTYSYVKDTGDVLGGLRNEGAKVLSYAPGATFVDRGLGKIAQKRLLKRTAYEVKEALGTGRESWYQKNAERAKKAGYTDVKVRDKNIIGPRHWFEREEQPLRRKAA